MTWVLLATLLGAEPSDEILLQHDRFTVQGKPLGPNAFKLPKGDWYAGPQVQLSAECMGIVVFNAAREVHLLVFDRKRQQVTENRLVAGYQKLTGAYEKSTRSSLRKVDRTWELITTVFLLDFEADAPGAPNTTGEEVSVFTFKTGKFEFTGSHQSPQR